MGIELPCDNGWKILWKEETKWFEHIDHPADTAWCKICRRSPLRIQQPDLEGLDGVWGGEGVEGGIRGDICTAHILPLLPSIPSRAIGSMSQHLMMSSLSKIDQVVIKHHQHPQTQSLVLGRLNLFLCCFIFLTKLCRKFGLVVKSDQSD